MLELKEKILSDGEIIEPDILKVDSFINHQINPKTYRSIDLEMEMSGADYVTAIATIGDSKKGLKRLKKALLEIDKELKKNGNICNDDPDENVYSRHAKQVMPVFKAMDGEKEAVPLKESCGRICGEFAYIYPPGIPLLAPGEQITEEILKTLH